MYPGWQQGNARKPLTRADLQGYRLLSLGR